MTGVKTDTEMKEIPVYLFTGFLGAGKTTFIKETLEHHEFGDDGRTLLLICEKRIMTRTR